MAAEMTNVEKENLKTERETKMEECYENLIVVDVGANLTNKKYSRDLDSVVQRAKDAGNYLISFFGLGIILKVMLVIFRRTKNYGHWYIC